jgi:hypothetical protein
MTFYEIAAAGFVVTLFLKFLLGGLKINYELDAQGELAINIAVATTLTLTNDMTFGTAVLAAACGMMAGTVWSLLQFLKVKTLFSLTRGVR